MGSIEQEDHPGMTTDLSQLGRRSRTDGVYADNLDIDVLIVGGGFGGIYSMYDMRKAFPNWKIVMYEAGVGYGGVWRFNIYPGARADSPVPIYQLSIPEVDEDFYWKDNYPNWEDLQRYFDHCDKKLNLSKDTAFESVVTGAEFDKEQAKWIVKTADGRTCKTRFLIIAAGFAAKRYFPDYPGINSFKGVIHHSSFWPIGKVDYVGKKFAVIGTGASGVQITQEVGPVVEKLTLYQRTPNLAIPMGKRTLTQEEQDRSKIEYPVIHAYRERNFGGFHYDLCERNTFDDNEEEREKFFHELVWERQGFALWLGGYKDYLFSGPANREAYNYWRRTQSPRVKNLEKRRILFPEEPKHHFGIKRPSLEQNYYEVLDQETVDIVDVSKEGTPIERFTEKGIVTTDGVEREADVVALATGFDVVTGGMTNMGLKSIYGTYLKDEWKEAANTYLGTTISGYPNMFHLYGAHGPTLLSNGPTCVEVQVRWIRDAIKQISRQNIRYINPSQEAQTEWKKHINDLAESTLFPSTVSTYMGGGLPGKAFEMTCYAGGLHVYVGEIREKLQGWQGFEVTKNTAEATV